MKVLFVVNGKYPLPGASSKRLANYIKALHIEQNEVELLPVYIQHSSNLQDIINTFLIPFLAFWRVLKNSEGNSVVFVYGFGWIGKLFIIFASRLRSKPVSIEINEKPYTIHGSRRDTVIKYIEPFHNFCLTRIVYPMIDGFIVISDGLFENIMKYKKKNSVICKVPILVDFEFYQKIVEKPECYSPYIIHTATLNDHKDGIINVFKAFAKITTEKGTDLFFYLTSRQGLTTIKNQIDGLVHQNRLENKVLFLGDLDEETLFAYQLYCNMVVINKVDCLQNKYNFATRLGEYLALGKPVITTEIGEVKNYLQNNVSCLFIDPDNPDEIVAAILRLLNDPDFSKKLGNAGKRIAKEKFDYKANSKILSNFFADVLQVVN